MHYVRVTIKTHRLRGLFSLAHNICQGRKNRRLATFVDVTVFVVNKYSGGNVHAGIPSHTATRVGQSFVE